MSTASIDWASLLKKSRQGGHKQDIYPYLNELCTKDTLTDETRLRLLGNAVAEDDVSRGVFKDSGLATDLLKMGGELPMHVLINSIIGSAEMASWLAANPDFPEAVAHSGLLGVTLAEEVIEQTGSMPTKVGDELLKLGFVQLIEMESKWETCPYIYSHFDKVFEACQKLPSDSASGVKIIGAISVHPELTLEIASKAKHAPWSWELVALLSNLTSKAAEIKPTLEVWPHAVAQTMDELKLQKFPFVGVACAGPFLRNVARDAETDKIIAEHGPVTEFVKMLASHPLMSNIGIEFAANYTAHIYDAEVVSDAIDLGLGPGSLMVCAKAAESMPSEGDYITEAQVVATTIEAILLEFAQAQVPAWVKGTYALGLLARKFPDLKVNWQKLKDNAPQHDAVEQNLLRGSGRE